VGEVAEARVTAEVAKARAEPNMADLQAELAKARAELVVEREVMAAAPPADTVIHAVNDDISLLSEDEEAEDASTE
jgi:hypothetical protein